MSLSADLANNTLDHLVAALGLHEIAGDDGARLVFRSPMSPEPVGQLRLFTGPDVGTVVNVTMTVPAIGLDSHMVYAFSGPGSAVPHFTVDSVQTGDMHAFHLDLVPRVDLPVNIAYCDAVYAPVNDAYESVAAIEGLESAHLGRRQWAVMSPWMLAHRATADAFVSIGAVVAAYRDHWIALLRDGLPAESIAGLSASDLDARDVRHRSVVFSPAVDPVWGMVDRLLGAEMSSHVRAILKDPKGHV